VTWRVVIADDEPVARAGLRAVLERDAELEVVAEARTGRELAAVMAATRPDLVFLDIEMPELDGFAALETLRTPHSPAVVFVTAHAAYAPRAFDVRAADYVLKPLRPSRVLDAVERAKERRRHDARSGPTIGVKLRDRILVLEQRTVDWLEADDEHVVLHVGASRHRVRESLSRIEGRLDPTLFVRVHRSTIVNVGRIREFQPYFHGDGYLLLMDGTRLRLSRTHREQVLQVLGAPS
jgi:two-component system LytT family response regulator